ncbi:MULTISPECIES: hypothetical protein, partial [unclassified Streptomyces]|uniref:hypothetical protein n=1 Tax=unclassified Streptomyces TaxID=2593676 RepID=UPI001C62D74A
MTTQIEEPVLDPYTLNPQHLTEQTTQNLLPRTARTTTPHHQLRHRKRTPIQLPVHRQRQSIQHHERRRHHVLRQHTRHPLPQ